MIKIYSPSGTLLASNDDYNEDDYNAKVTKELQANVSYYVVYSLYNPSIETSERLTLLISKE